VHRRERDFHANRDRYATLRHIANLAYQGEVSSAPRKLWQVIECFEGHSVLDLGCGEGWLSRRLQHKFSTVVGLDISLESLQRDLLSICGAAENLPFKTHTFDAVVGSAILHHIPSLDSAIQEMRRILRPGGRFAFAEPLAGHPLVALYRRLSPKARSIDEEPFSLSRLRAAFDAFEEVEAVPLDLLSIVAAPLNVLPATRGWTPKVAEILRVVDNGIFMRWPQFTNGAWCAVVSGAVR
jgi:SAM-dependent methyltransferase